MWNKIQRIYIGDHNQVYPTWKPTSSTLAWRPLKENLNDYSWNNHNFSIWTWSVSYSDNMATFQRLTCSWFSLYNYSWDFTLSLWCTPFTWTDMGFFPIINSQGYPSIWFSNQGMWIYYNWWKQVDYSWTLTGVHLITWTKTSSKLTFYIDGVQVAQSSWSYGTTASWSVNNTWLWRNINGTGSWTCGDVIIENRCWTADEISEYYNQTKAKYKWFN